MSDKPTYTRSKPCVRCGRAFSPDEWYTYRENGVVYWKSVCAICTKALAAQWQKDNPIRQAAHKKRHRLNKSLRRMRAA